MLGFSQITRPRTSAAASAPGNRDADGYDRTVTRLRRQALRIPATYFAISQPGSPVTIDIWPEQVSRWARTPARLRDHEGSAC
jgi:hypothetical protein